MASTVIAAGREGARDLLIQAIPIADELRKSDPENVTFISGQAQALNKLSRLETADGDFDQALVHAKGSLELFQEVAKRDLGNTTAEMLVGTAWDQVFQVYVEHGDFEQAISAELEAYNTHLRLCSIDTKSYNLRFNVLDTASKIGSTYQRMGDQKLAYEWFQIASEQIDHSQDLPNVPKATVETYGRYFSTILKVFQSMAHEDRLTQAHTAIEAESGYAKILGDSF